MKKKNLKNLELNKKTISNFNQSSVKAGSVFTIAVCVTAGCTLGNVCELTRGLTKGLSDGLGCNGN